ncbi:hypothetical protein ZWY2020_021928 [Hordeum vulgare]|nr:hypothetical protein ZWY2020_021928 [Hordeum vulgare]
MAALAPLGPRSSLRLARLDPRGRQPASRSSPRRGSCRPTSSLPCASSRTTPPSVVYITNLVVRQDAFTLDVLEVLQGSGSGFVWDKLGHIVTNFHVICGASDLRLEQRGWLDQQGRLELVERRRRRLELPDRRPNLSNNSKEDATRCLVSLGDLIDVEKLGSSLGKVTR